MLRAAVMPVTFGFKTHAIHGAIYFRNARNRLDLLGKRGFLFQVDYFAAKTCRLRQPLVNHIAHNDHGRAQQMTRRRTNQSHPSRPPKKKEEAPKNPPPPPRPPPHTKCSRPPRPP